METLQIVIDGLGTILLILTLVALARSNNRLGASVRLNTLQAMIAEMNQLRRNRAANPDLERTLFDSRADWSDLQIQQHMSAVQLANVFEWAYLARREGLIEADVWRSWVETWRAVILGSEPLRNSFTPNVWTFGREHHMAQVLDALITGTGEVPDPLQDKSRFARKIAGI